MVSQETATDINKSEISPQTFSKQKEKISVYTKIKQWRGTYKMENLLEKKSRAQKTQYLIDTESFLPGLDLLQDSSRLFGEIDAYKKQNSHTAKVLQSLHHLNTLYSHDVRLFKTPNNSVIEDDCSENIFSDTQYPETLLESVYESRQRYTEVMQMELASLPKGEIDQLPRNLKDVVYASQYVSAYPMFLVELESYTPCSDGLELTMDSLSSYDIPEELEQSAYVVYHLAPFMNTEFRLYDRPVTLDVLLDKDDFLKAYPSEGTPKLLSPEGSQEALLRTLGYHMMRLEWGSQEYDADIRPFFSVINERKGTF